MNALKAITNAVFWSLELNAESADWINAFKLAWLLQHTRKKFARFALMKGLVFKRIMAYQLVRDVSGFTQHTDPTLPNLFVKEKEDAKLKKAFLINVQSAGLISLRRRSK